jgi:hypothetical protein
MNSKRKKTDRKKKKLAKKETKKENWQLCFNFFSPTGFQSCEEWLGRFVVTRENYFLNAFQNSLTTDSPTPTNNSTVLIFQVDDMNEFGAFYLHTNWKAVRSIAIFLFLFNFQVQNLQLLLTPFSSNFQDLFQDNCFGERRHIYFIGLHLSILKPATPACFDFPTKIRRLNCTRHFGRISVA